MGSVLVGCDQQALVSPTNMNALPDKEGYLIQRLEADFTNPDLHCELALYYLSEEQWDKAQYHIRTGLGLDPGHRRLQAANMQYLVAKKDTAGAEQTFGKYQSQLRANPPEMVRFGKALGDVKLDAYALRSFERALVLSPRSAEAHRQLGYYYLARNDMEQAKDHFTKSLEYNANQADVAGELGKMGVVVETPAAMKTPVKQDTGNAATQ